VFCGLGNIQVEEIKKMKIGDPLDRSTDHGPQNHKAHLEKLLQYCDTGVKEGATLVYGGRQVQRPGKSISLGSLWGTCLLKLEFSSYHHLTAKVNSDTSNMVRISLYIWLDYL
jgi:hypothetical protein